MRRTLPALLLLTTVPAFAANYATCLLDALPGTQNDVAAHAAMQVCQSKHPGGLEAVQQGSGRGIFGYNSGAECTAKKAGDTRSQRAAYIIGAACQKLYDTAPPGMKPVGTSGGKPVYEDANGKRFIAE